MKDSDLESVYRSNNGVSMIAALRLIYNMGYCDGASITPDANFVDRSAVVSKPSDSAVLAVKQKIGK